MVRYQKHASRVRQIVARINSKYAPSAYEGDSLVPPVVYLEQNVPFSDLVAL